jgi:ankyrin repeat protein
MRGALYYAIHQRSIPIVEFLISKGADIFIHDCKGDSIMHCACDSKYKNMVLYLLMNNHDYKTLSLTEELPGHHNGDIKAFMSEVPKNFHCLKKNKERHLMDFL